MDRWATGAMSVSVALVPQSARDVGRRASGTPEGREVAVGGVVTA